MSVTDQQFVSARPLNHSRFSAIGPLRELAKSGPWAAAASAREDWPFWSSAELSFPLGLKPQRPTPSSCNGRRRPLPGIREAARCAFSYVAVGEATAQRAVT